MIQPSISRRPALAFLVPFFFTLLLGASLAPAWAGELGSATLQIAGTRLSVSPIGQTVPFDTPTLVETHLQGYDAGLGALPSSLRVLGDFSGPGIEGVVALSTLPNEPFRIPRLRIKGAYSLSNIRLVQDGQVLGYGDPRSVSINATQILITKVSARPLTQDEMNSYGIVLDSSNYQTLNLTFGFAFEGQYIDYNMPVVYRLFNTDGEWGLPVNEIRLPDMSGGTVDNPRFRPPQMLPFKLELDPEELAEQVPSGGCDIKQPLCRALEPPAPPMVGVILFPTELTLLHQFFSVVLTVQNGAPEGDPLVIRDLTAKATFPSGLRPARTEPPTPLGVPVPLRVPGPDGEVGTADDITFLIAQAAGEAEFLVEGLREGTHLVQFDLAGTLEGLPGGPKPISGKAKGAVVVRDPTLSVTISHPDVVRAQEEYPLYLTVTNLGKAPVNALDVGFKTAGLAGTQVVGDATQEVGNLLPGDSRVVEFEMKALVTGKVVSSSARAGGSTRPGFELTVGVADGVPLSPESLVLPSTSKHVPKELYKEALGLIGLAWSLAKAPPSVAGSNPQATEGEMNDRVYRLSQMGRQVALGEEVFDAASALAAEWLGARDGGWEWDGVRRKTTRGREVARALGELLAAEVDGNAGISSGSEAIDVAERVAATTHYLSPIVLGSYGSGLELEIASRTSGKVLRGRGAGATRELPFAELYPLSAAAELGMVARAEEGGYRARLRRLAGSGNVSFALVLPAASPAAEPTRFVWPNFVLAAGEVATLEFDALDAVPALAIDEDGDGDSDREVLPSISQLARRPFEVVRAQLDFDVDLSAHVVEVLFSADVDLASLAPRDPEHFRIEGRVSNGGMTPREESISLAMIGGPEIENPLEGLFNPRIVRVVFNNPIAPNAETIMTVADLLDSAGREFGEQEVEIVAGPGALPGASVAGRVIDPYGEPLPFAEVSLFETDLAGVENLNDECVRHRSARTRADAEGRFRFEYVRQTACGNFFELEAIDPATPHGGKARGEIRFVDQEMTLNVVMLGRARVRGKVTYSDGTVPPGLKVLAYNPVFDEGRQASVKPNGEYQMAEVVVGTVTLYAYDDLGNRVFQTIEVPSAGAEVVRDLVMLKQSATSSAATLRGEVTHLVGGEPSPGAYVVLSIDGQELGTQVTGGDGAFDFGTVPTGGAELVVYHPATGRSGAKLALTLVADQNAFVQLHLRDDRGRFVGYVKRQAADGSVTPMADAVVYVASLPFNTRTDANGYYELPDVLTGEWRVVAADLAVQQQVTVRGTIEQGQDTRVDLYFRDTAETRGAIAGTVYGVDGLPVKNALIHLAGDEWSVRWHHEAATDSAGRFRIENMEPGIYGVHAMKGTDGAIGYANVRFPGDLADIGIHFVRSRIFGRTFTRDDDGNPFGVISLIRYRPVEVVSEWGLVAVAQDYTTLTTNTDGTFSIDALPGPFELIVHNSFHGTQSRSYHLGAVPVEANIEFQRSGSIHGVVLDHDGATPVPGVELRLSGGTFSDYTIHSDENGEFDFDLLPPGGYGIMAIDQRGGILREGFASVIVHRYGDQVDMKVTLPEQGTVYGQVFDADWGPLANVAVTLRGDRYPRQVMTQNTDAEGRFVFSNVYAGKIALVAKAPELGGLGGKLQVEVGMEGEEVIAEIQLEGVGELQGRIINPDQNTPVPNAEVRIEAFGIGSHASYTYTINTDFEGVYRFDRLPLTSYRIFAFDPSSGRHGVSGWTPVEEHGQVVALDVELEARGTVEGHLYNDPSQQTVPGATIQLISSGMVRFEVFSSTDIDGHFEFGGIPEGEFKLATTVDGRRARNEGILETEDQVVTRDLHLEALAKIEGVVRLPRTAAGPSTALAGNVNVVVRRSGRVVAAASENPFVIEGLLPGNYEVEAREIDGDRQVIQTFALAAGAAQTVDLELRGFLPAQVHVFEANGQPAPAGLSVAVTNYYKLSNKATNDDLLAPVKQQVFSGNIASGNTFSVSAVRQGRLNVVVTDPLYPTRKGTGSVVTGYEGEVAHVNVSLVATGTICGVVYLTDGTTPAAGARVAVKPSSEGYRLTDADEDGHFCFDILPRVSFRIDAQQAGGLGTYALTGSWATGEYEKTYSIVLDDANPRVVSVSPAHNTTGVPLSAKLIVEFSEAVCRTCGGIALYNAGGWGIGFTTAWSTDGKTATLTPSLQSDTSYRLVLRRPLADLSGREIAYEVTTVFKTADVVPPKVSEVLPANNTNQVPIATTIKITFSEPIDPNLASGNFQLVRVDQGNFAETLIPLVIAENRRVALTVTPDLAPDHLYELRVSGIRDTSGNLMAAPFISRFFTADTTPPDFAWTTPAEGQLVEAGEKVVLQGVPTDVRGVASVEYEIGGRRQLTTAAPYRAEIRAPFAAAAGPVTVTAVAKDIFGNQATFTRTIVVEPQASAAAPTIGLSCPADGDWVERGVAAEVALSIADDQAIESWELRVDGQPVKTALGLDAAALIASYSWKPPAATAPGTSFALELVARDFGGAETVRNWTVSVPTIEPIKSGLLPEGQTRVLGAGNIHLPPASRSLTGLTLLQGAKLLGVEGSALVLSESFRAQCGSVTTIDDLQSPLLVMESGSTLTGFSSLKALRLAAGTRMTVEAGALVDVSGKGYQGGTSGGVLPYGPAGVAVANYAGGSHGGQPDRTTQGGAIGEVYDSVYRPQMAGGGAASVGREAGAGGGVIDLTAGELVLDGELRSRGYDLTSSTNGGSSGAGGSIRVVAAAISGSGKIDAAGGGFTSQQTTCSSKGSIGGGGRVSLAVANLDDFDLASQVTAEGGRYRSSNGAECVFQASPGTIYVRTPASTYGDLIVDAGTMANGADRLVPATQLPALGSGALSAFAAAGADAWISRSGNFAEKWHGAWVELLAAGGGSLGVFEAVERDGAGRLRLSAAGAVSGAESYQGRYRFDAVKVKHGAGLSTTDVIDTAATELAGEVEVTGTVLATHLVVKAGAVVRPAAGSTLTFRVTETMTVEAGARIDVSGLGYQGGTSGAPPYGPAGVAVAQYAGGSHGGQPDRTTQGGVIGEVYDSVYLPQLSGGGAAYPGRVEGAGGGLIDLEAGHLVLDGELRSRGYDLTTGTNGGSTGAGGSIRVVAAAISGSGKIDAAGGRLTTQQTTCPSKGSVGGGGRVSLRIAELGDFDLASQVTAEGGRHRSSNGTECVFEASPGTIYVRTPASTYGDLIVDAGTMANGADRLVPATPLPALGAGAISASEASGADAWISRSGAFAEKWQGAWVELFDGAGASQGLFEAVERDGVGRLRLAGAAGAAGVATYQGHYRFDKVTALHGAGLQASDPVATAATELTGNVQVAAVVTATNLVVKAGAVVRPAAGSMLTFRVTGTMTVEAGAVVDVSGLGYQGGSYSGSTSPPFGPAGVTLAQYAGGSHGGQPDRTTQGGVIGEIYDSVYRPQMSGGGGAYPGRVPGAGGGVIDIEAGTLVLAGELRSRGYEAPSDSVDALGGGGSVVVKAATLSGAGRIDVAGGSSTRVSNTCNNRGSMGGGGRAALLVSSFDGFDPATQVTAQGGRMKTSGGAECVYQASPGTIYIETSSSTYGDLLIDAGTLANGADRTVPATQLPALGAGAISAFEAAGADAWISRTGNFAEKWHGVWVELLAAGGGSLGVFEAVERDGAGRLRLSGAGAVTGAVSHKGRYRFDAVTVKHGAGLFTSDVIDTAATELAGEVEVTGAVTATNLVVKAGAVVRPASGSALIFRVSGTMTVEAGAVVDVSGKGYQGGTGSALPYGPAGVAVAQYAGGSHGGQPDRTTQGGVIGETFDSVYRPQMSGGGGAYPGRVPGAGGGVIDIEAGTLVLAGELRSRGYEAPSDSVDALGAGGSIVVKVATLAGSGKIDVAGASSTRVSNTCNNRGSMGGGGRAALLVSSFDGFDPATQVTAQGGRMKTSGGAECLYQASPGTIYLRTPSSTYGSLILDAGTMANGADRIVPATPLPVLGTGAVSVFELAGADAWISRSGLFAEKWHGAWVELLDQHGDLLGIFEAAERDGGGRLRLAGAGSVSAAVAGYRGVYRFDAVTRLHGAELSAVDPLELGSALTLGGSVVFNELRVPSLQLGATAILKPVAGSPLRLVVAGTLTIDAGGKIDLNGGGYPGSLTGGQPGGAPAGVTGSIYSGGSHGGSGDTETGTAGAVYDSVYRPSLGGGGASTGHSVTNSRGGGVVQIEAGSLVLQGQILARGDDYTSSSNSAGAGGSVRIAAGQLSGAGLIDAGGGNQTGCSTYTGAGGGGRVALEVADLSGFDFANQARAFSGFTNCSGTIDRRAGAGTLYLKTSGSTYGTLRIDAGRPAGLADRVRTTRLPILGATTVAALAPAGGDAWLTGGMVFPEAWLGAWVELLDASAQPLGLFEAKSRDAAGRLRLAGAGSVAGAASCRGRYRFDQRILTGGASLLAHELEGQPAPVMEGNVFIEPDSSYTDLTITSGSVVKPSAGQKLTLRVAGTLRIEAGATIDLSAVNPAPMSSPFAPVNAGGSHGGGGDTLTGTPGGTYDSVQRPQLAGGGPYDANGLGLGGGAVEIEAGSVVLDGGILVKASSFTSNGYSSGAGGAVRIAAGALSGAGLIDASGGYVTFTGTCYGNTGAGGGGRVALAVGGFSGFDPLVQTRVWGGITDCAGTAGDRFAAAGTLYLKTPASTYGTLVIDAGESWNGAVRNARPTQLPLLGSGAPSSLTVAGGDAWLARSGGFAEHWLGAFVELRSAAGALLGSFEVAERNGSGALRLLGAATASGATQYRGSHRFDEVKMLRGGALSAGDPLHSTAALVLERSGGLAELHAPSLEVKSPAIVTAIGGTMDLRLAGALTLQAGAVLDAGNGGYPGTNGVGTPGGAPAGITGSIYAGGSHGGAGDTANGTPGLVYDSVYQPQLGGGGGANRAQSNSKGRGGGVIKIAASSVALGGQVLAKGESHSDDGYSAGAGGTISIVTPALSGAGLVDASGGTQTATGSACSAPSGGGGGGRVAILAGSLGGFDPATQARAYSGRTDCPNNIPDRYAGAGTVYVKTAASTYGSLHLDPGVSATGTARVKGTNLPTLGVFTASSAVASSGDAWVQRSGGFAEAWAGVWVELRDAGGTVLGLYEAVERDGSGRLRLAGAAAAAAQTASGRGYYRFDEVVIRNGAGFYLAERYGEGAYATGLATMEADYAGTDFTLAPGALVQPLSGHRISLRLSGTLTVGAGAKIDVSTTSAALPPAGIVAALNAGGSHGGRGDTVTGTAGATFDSVYRPLLPGAPGNSYTLVTADGRGGGLLEIDAAKVVLDGELLARGGGFTRGAALGAAGAGGTVRIDTPELAGSGLIDASGGDLVSTDCHYQTGAGGGGRVALNVADLDSFTVDSQVRAWPGVTDCPGTADRFAATGTIYVATAGSTYGRLLVDGGEPWGGAPRAALTTVLPPLGGGAPSGLTAAGGDAWLARTGGFPEHWLGVWVELRNSGGTLLGTYRVAERNGTAQLRLAGAAAAVGQATAYQGVYRFDGVDAVRGGIVDTGEAPAPGAPTIIEGTVLAPSPLVATNLLLRTNAILRPQTGTTLTLRVSGTLTVEAGAKIDVGGLVATLPTGITPAPVWAGGSHGGSGDSNNGSPTGTLGPVFDSVYRPQLAGSAGSVAASSNRAGGVLDLEAGSLVLAGELNAAGALGAAGGTAGAGGSVRVKATTLSGAGSINASGGNLALSPGACNWNSGAGGGGRVGLEVGSFSGFDPQGQVKAWAGLTDCPGTADRFAAAGTIYWKTSASTYGQLLLDAGEPVDGLTRQPRVTRLPVLGNGTLSTLTAAGADAWLVRSGNFAEHWWGVWVELRDASDALIGVYEAAERDSGGRLRLAGAAAAAGTAAKYKGIYRFDALTLKRSATFESFEPIEATSAELLGQVEIGSPFAAGQLTVKSGAVVKPLKGGGSLTFRVSGAMTVEAGAKLDVGAAVADLAPAGTTPAAVWAGGSHGGTGDTGLGTVGGTFDSVYRPQLAGSAGAASHSSNRAGGVLDIEAGSLALEGELNAAGALAVAGATAGAGGTVRVKTATFSGVGSIDASGGNLGLSPGACNWNSGAAGGGRVGLEVGSFSVFDPAAQIKAWAGVTDCPGTADRFAAAGTIYWKTSASTYGTLKIAAGDNWNGVQRTPRATVLPTLGTGSFTSLTASGADAWLVRSTAFPAHWLGVWVELKDGSGTVIGTYEAVERNSGGELRLAGASAAAGSAASYRGFYRFDEVMLRQGSALTGADTIEAGAYTSSWTPGEGEAMESLALEGAADGDGAAGERAPGFDLEGRLFNDLDGDGAAGSTEPPIVGARVGAYGAAGERLAEAITDRLGRYRLTGIPAGSLVAVDADSLPGGVDLPTSDADGIATADRVLFSGQDGRRFDFGYRQADLALPSAAPAPACAGCAPAVRATPAPSSASCLEGAPLDTVFLLDLGGLAAPFAGAASRLEAAQLALVTLERQLAERGDGSRFALLTYRGAGESAEIHLLQGLSTRADAFEDRLFGLAAQDLAGGGSPAAVALRAAADLLAGSRSEGRQPRIVWLGDRAPDVDARLRPAAGFGGSLLEADGGFRSAAEVVPLGGFSRRLGTFGGQATADAMVAIEEAGGRAPGLRIDGIALRGAAGRAPVEDLHDYAAAFTAGSRAAAADLRALEIAVEDLWNGFVCTAR